MHDYLISAVITVGEGRGFVIEGRRGRLVVTAAHCLPYFPPCHTGSYLHERTYRELLGRLDQTPSVWAECLFADPIGDIAILGSPDNRELSEQAEQFDTLTDGAAFRISDAASRGQGWLLSLDSIWHPCDVGHHGGPLWISHATHGIIGGMSGSPILSNEGAAVGVVSTGFGLSGRVPTEGGPNARLVYNLPAWVLA